MPYTVEGCAVEIAQIARELAASVGKRAFLREEVVLTANMQPVAAEPVGAAKGSREGTAYGK